MSYLGINENRTNVIQQIDRSEPKYIVVNNQVELTSNMKDLLKEIIVWLRRNTVISNSINALKKINILCFRKFLEFSPQDIDFIPGVV